MTYNVTQDRDNGSIYRAEAIDYDGDGSCYVVSFFGPNAAQRADDYARWMNGEVDETPRPPKGKPDLRVVGRGPGE